MEPLRPEDGAKLLKKPGVTKKMIDRYEQLQSQRFSRRDTGESNKELQKLSNKLFGPTTRNQSTVRDGLVFAAIYSGVLIILWLIFSSCGEPLEPLDSLDAGADQHSDGGCGSDEDPIVRIEQPTE